MTIACPYCGHAEPDDFELIEVNELHDDLVCFGCKRVFAVLIKNCIRCDFEQALTWRVESMPSHAVQLPCVHCGHSEVQSDALGDL